MHQQWSSNPGSSDEAYLHLIVAPLIAAFS
jgi:hypothetical protein